MGKIYAYGELSLPSQGSQNLHEYVKLQEAFTLADIQNLTNAYLTYLSSDAIGAQIAIRDVSFDVIDKSPPGGGLIYYSKVHIIVIGDTNEEPV